MLWHMAITLSWKFNVDWIRHGLIFLVKNNQSGLWAFYWDMQQAHLNPQVLVFTPEKPWISILN